MESSSSSSSEDPKKITIVVGPVELTTLVTDEATYQDALSKIAKDLNVPVPALFTLGVVKLFHGEEIRADVRDAAVDVRIR